MQNDFPYKTSATLIFDPADTRGRVDKYWVIARVKGEVIKYYSHLFEKRYGSYVRSSYTDEGVDIKTYPGNIRFIRPEYGAHVSIIQGDNSIKRDWKEYKKAFNGKKIEIEYCIDPRTANDIKYAGRHWWLKCRSQDAVNIRTAMGLGADANWPLHLTLGSPTPQTAEFSKQLWINYKKSNPD